MSGNATNQELARVAHSATCAVTALQRAVAVVALASEFAASSFTGARTKYQSWSEERQKVQSPRAFGAVIPVTGVKAEQKKSSSRGETAEGMQRKLIRARSCLPGT
jgi:hypothetical protein